MTTNQMFSTLDEAVDILKNQDCTGDFMIHLQRLLIERNYINIFYTKIEFDNFETDFIVNLIRECLPQARFGFDYSPHVKEKFNKEGVKISSPGQGWVKLPAIDWSISHSKPGQAMLIALLLVLRDLEKQNAGNVPN